MAGDIARAVTHRIPAPGTERKSGPRTEAWEPRLARGPVAAQSSLEEPVVMSTANRACTRAFRRHLRGTLPHQGKGTGLARARGVRVVGLPRCLFGPLAWREPGRPPSASAGTLRHRRRRRAPLFERASHNRPGPEGPGATGSEDPMWCASPRCRTPCMPEGMTSSFDCQGSPLRQHHAGRVLPQTEACFGPLVPPSRHVPPSRSPTALTACATRRLQACCSLHPTMRFAGFRLPRLRARSHRRPPHRRSTLQSLPLCDSASRVTTRGCLLVVRRPAGPARPRGLAPSSSPLRVTSGEGGARPVLSWASRPGAPSAARRHVTSRGTTPTQHRPRLPGLLHTPHHRLAGFRALPLKGPRRGRRGARGT